MPVLTRRAFLKTAGLGAALLLPRRLTPEPPPQWPEGPALRLGRVALPGPVRVMSRPHPQSSLQRWLQPDDVVIIRRDVVGKGVLPHNHVWFEIEGGYVYSPYLQPVRNRPNAPLTTLGEAGVWSEVTVPFVEAYAQPDSNSAQVYRLYYSSTFLLTALHLGPDGSAWYRVFDENGSRMFAAAAAFRPIGADELLPLAPDVENKRIEVYLTDQSLSAFENGVEVFHARIASGAFFFGEDGRTLLNGTPAGPHPIWRKRISRHMEGGTRDAGYDLPGVGWVAYFSGNGAAIHATYWHNDFGTPKSHGCLNCRPEDAKWLFRWSNPAVAYKPGDVESLFPNPGTPVIVSEA